MKFAHHSHNDEPQVSVHAQWYGQYSLQLLILELYNEMY